MLEIAATSTVSASVSASCVRRLALARFRNYAALDISVEASPVVLAGENGAGKTNLLEAISFLAPGRGLRRARLADADCRGEAGAWAVAAEVVGPRGQVAIGTGRDAQKDGERDAGDKRIVKIDGKRVGAQTELSRHMTVLWLTPQMDQLWHEGGSSRRKFLDRLAYGFDGDHAGRVASYDYAMRERNRLLDTGLGDDAWLSTLERAMAEKSVAIAAARLQTVERLNAAMQHAVQVFPQARMELEGWVEMLLTSGASAVQVEEMLMDKFASLRGQDALAGRATAGVHKSELKVYHLGKAAEAACCSTGEQKALLLGIVLAQAHASAQWQGTAPVLLLDEVAAHLDERRRDALLQELLALRVQAWLTGTDPQAFRALGGTAQYFNIHNGNVSV